ncbi:ferritin-like domain-containing protein [Kitasatospora aureofaciens]|uniref:ferritin-like domain-containing protein n=1 Tax=Kitasatospora aureofaciens TaxID=1894 RepID=UPI0037FDADCA
MQPPSRRTFLALGLLLTTGGALTACTDSHHNADQGRTNDRRPDPDEPLRLRAVATTDTLLAGYDTLLAGPGAGQAAQLQPLRAEVAQHRAALATGLPTATPSTSGTTSPASPSAPSSPTPSSSPSPFPSPTAITTVAALATLERQTAQTRLADLGAASPQLARLLAAVSACGALHATALGDTAPPPTPAASPSESPSASAAGPALGSDALTALQGALSAEHAAIYGYGVVGARLPDDQQRADARTAYAAHQARRDAWQRLLGSVGATPSAAAAGYQLPFAVTDAAGATRLAAHIETRLTTVYADLVAAVPAPQRPTAAEALRESAARARHWGAAPTPFPGLPAPAPTTPASATPTPTP